MFPIASATAQSNAPRTPPTKPIEPGTVLTILEPYAISNIPKPVAAAPPQATPVPSRPATSIPSNTVKEIFAPVVQAKGIIPPLPTAAPVLFPYPKPTAVPRATALQSIPRRVSELPTSVKPPTLYPNEVQSANGPKPSYKLIPAPHSPPAATTTAAPQVLVVQPIPAPVKPMPATTTAAPVVLMPSALEPKPAPNWPAVPSPMPLSVLPTMPTLEVPKAPLAPLVLTPVTELPLAQNLKPVELPDTRTITPPTLNLKQENSPNTLIGTGVASTSPRELAPAPHVGTATPVATAPAVPTPVMPRATLVTPELPMPALSPRQTILSAILGAALAVQPLRAAEPPVPTRDETTIKLLEALRADIAELREKDLSALKRDVDTLKSFKKETETLLQGNNAGDGPESMMKRMSRLDETLKAVERKLQSIDNKLSDTTRTAGASPVNDKPAAMPKDVADPDAGTIRIVNGYDVRISMVVNGKAYRLEPDETRDIPVSAGSVEYQLLGTGGSIVNRSVKPKEIVTLWVH